MKKLILIAILLWTTSVFAAPSNSVSIPHSFSPNTTIESSKVNADFNEVSNKYNAHSHADITQVGTITIGGWNASVIGSQYGGTGLDLSGASGGGVLVTISTGNVGLLTHGTSGQFLQSNGPLTPSWVTGGSAIHQITSGFEFERATRNQATMKVLGGTLFHNSTLRATTASVTLTFATANDWWDGATDDFVGGASWCYVGIASVGHAKLLGNNRPNFFDLNGRYDPATAEKVVLYWRPPAGTSGQYWRVLGAVPVNTSNQVATGFIQRGKNIWWLDDMTFWTGTENLAWKNSSLAPVCPVGITEEVNVSVFNNGAAEVGFKTPLGNNESPFGPIVVIPAGLAARHTFGWVPVARSATYSIGIASLTSAGTAQGYADAYKLGIR